MSKKLHVEAKINGKDTEFLCEPRQSLLEVLRDVLQLTGARRAATTATAAPATSLLDGRLVNSCIVLGAEIQGQAGADHRGSCRSAGLHPLQQKFLEHAALQCGICTPGFIVAAKALLEQESPNPTEDQVRHWLAGNLCRCTGYDKIIRAVLDAAECCGTAAQNS